MMRAPGGGTAAVVDRSLGSSPEARRRTSAPTVMSWWEMALMPIWAEAMFS